MEEDQNVGGDYGREEGTRGREQMSTRGLYLFFFLLSLILTIELIFLVIDCASARLIDNNNTKRKGEQNLRGFRHPVLYSNPHYLWGFTAYNLTVEL